ncbi:MAG: hypothetical protein IJY15_10760 [Thermoguttaceae bacterium]|nr:hypothetical protein [Thermoguttaceae bacterium]MBQ9128223.1 hypothetical protein [Thermoguttaceae bacterium]
MKNVLVIKAEAATCCAVAFVSLGAGGEIVPTNAAQAQDGATRGAGNAWRNSIGMELRRIPTGTFKMGSPSTEEGRERRGSDETRREVEIARDFYRSVYETRRREAFETLRSAPSSTRKTK